MGIASDPMARHTVLALVTLLALFTTSAALLPQTGALRGTRRVSRTGGIRGGTWFPEAEYGGDPEETRDSEEEEIIQLHRADGSLVDDLRQDLRAKLSKMLEREEALREEARANAPASDRVWRVSRSTPTKKSAIGKRVGAFLSPPSSPCP